MYHIKSVDFEGSFAKVAQCPQGDIPEVAFIGRSNVGKSSIINMLTDRKEIARVSKKPGKTTLLNFFLINKIWRLVDLPGYGYAVSSKSNIKNWDKMVRSYFLERTQLRCVFVLIDGNIKPQRIDLEYISWLGEHGVPMSIVFTKSDKSKPRIYNANKKLFEKTFLQEWEALPPTFVTSAGTRKGKDELLSFIFEIVQD